jgi:hypothetical protein
MPHRGSLHARRRVGAYPTPFLDVHTEDGTNAMVSEGWDDVRYDDVVPVRLRGTLVVDDNGEPAGLTDLRAERRLACPSSSSSS